MRGAPQYGFALAIRWIKARTSELACGRPAPFRREILAQYIRKPLRCQPTTVSPFTRCKASPQKAQSRESTTQNNRSFFFSLGTPFLLLGTPSCCRKARFSNAKSRRSLRVALIKNPSHRSVSIMGWSVDVTTSIINRFRADGVLAMDTH